MHGSLPLAKPRRPAAAKDDVAPCTACSSAIGEVFSGWCRERGIRPRFGAVGRQGSIAVVERMIRTVNDVGSWYPVQQAC
jgi:hypothetical protein